MRAILCVLDSLGIGSADSARPEDQGANTFGHVAIAAARGEADREGLRSGPLVMPNLARTGLSLACEAASGTPLPVARPDRVDGLYGFAAEVSWGKDTPSGHWEMLGLPVEYDWGYFPKLNSFPPELLRDLIEKAGLPGVLGNAHASGTEVIKTFGEEHIRTGKPIVYTSADSVFQIAAHETHFGLERLYEVCLVARDLVDAYNVGRVIARPFVGESAETFKRTTNRKDYATPPSRPTLMDMAKAAGREVIAIGKIDDIFAHSGVTRKVKGGYNDTIFDAVNAELKDAPDGSLIVANFNDFDTLYGHRRDVAGYASAIEHFDRRFPEILSGMREGDLLVLSADHGCDPTWPGSDHTREYVPVIALGSGVTPGPLGRRETFADIGASLSKHLGLEPLQHGASFL